MWHTSRKKGMTASVIVDICDSCSSAMGGKFSASETIVIFSSSFSVHPSRYYRTRFDYPPATPVFSLFLVPGSRRFIFVYASTSAEFKSTRYSESLRIHFLSGQPDGETAPFWFMFSFVQRMLFYIKFLFWNRGSSRTCTSTAPCKSYRPLTLR